MITIYYKKKRIYLIASIFTMLFIVSLIGIFYFWQNPAYISSRWLFKLPGGFHRLGHPVSAWWISTVFTLLLGFCVYLLYHMLENKPVATVNSEGVAVKNLPFIPWHIVERVQITTVKGQEFVEIRLHDMHAYKKRLTWPYALLFKLNDLVGDFHVSLPNMLTMNNSEILKVLASYKVKTRT